jgi:hypothetical protein
MGEHLKWYDESADNSPWIDALAELRQRATREGYCYQHVQAITVAIDQYAEKGAGQPRLLSQQALRRWLAPLPDRISQSVIFWGPHYPAYLINREAVTAWVGTRPRAHNRRDVSSGAVRCVLSWP